MHVEELASGLTSTSDETLVYHSDIFILLILLAVSLFNIPRALLYIANHRSEVLQGCFLRSTAQLRLYWSPTMARKSTGTEGRKEPSGFSLPTVEREAVLKQPWHFPMHLSFRHPAASFMQYRTWENYTIVQTFLMAGYAAVIFYAAFYASNPFSNPKRIGWVIASQIPFVYAFATKNNIIGLLVGVGYEKLNYFHRHVGRLIVIGANVHAIGYLYKWSIAGNISEKINQPYVIWGVLALVCFDLLGFLSLRYFRMKSYNIFFGTHVVASVAVLFAVCYHQRACVPYVTVGSIVYGLDHIIRAIKTRVATATLRTIPELGFTRLDIPSINTGWRAGQHVRLRVLSTTMGIWGMTEAHPFTIASAANTKEGLVLMCKKTGKWTGTLYEMAQTPAIGEQGREPERTVNVIVEGPYGGIGDTTLSSYSGVMLVAGGSGVTFALSGVQDLVLAGAKSRAQVIEVIWCIRNPVALRDFNPLFATLVSHSGPTRLRVRVFYTRNTSSPLEGLVLPPGITLTPGRPNIKELLNGVITSTMSRGGAHGIFVGVCSPVALAKDVARTVRTCNVDLKRAVGGIQLHEEVFGW